MLRLLIGLLCAPGAAAFAVDLAVSSLAAQYSGALVSKPLETKVASACVLAVAGDAIAQSREPGGYDTRRAGSFVAFDSVYRGGFQHYAFPLIADAVVSENALVEALERTCFNQLVIVPIVYYPLFFAITGYVQGLTNEQSLDRAREMFVPLMKRNLLFWIPVQFVQFYWVDPSWQVSFVCVAGLVWNVILSAIAGDCSDDGCSPELLDETEEIFKGTVVPAAAPSKSPAGFIDDSVTSVTEGFVEK